MGKFSDLIELSIAGVAGPLRYGSTLVPVSEFVPMILAQSVKGGYFSVPDTDTLLDIPYEMMDEDMEVVVRAHVLPGPITVPKKKFFLKQKPPAGLKVNEVVGYDIDNYWTEILSPSVIEGDDGDDGDNGWTIQVANVTDGPTRVVQRVIGYVGGEGTPPVLDPNQNYVGPNGLTTLANATNIKGATGDSPVIKPDHYQFVCSDPANETQALISHTSNQDYLLLVRANIQNTHIAARKFFVKGQVYWARPNLANNAYVYINLRKKLSLGAIAPVTGNSWIPSGDFQSLDYHRELIQAPDFSDSIANNGVANQRLFVEKVIEIPAGGTHSVYLSARLIQPGATIINLNRSVGSLEIIGI